MSEQRQTLPSDAVDQGARAAEVDAPVKTDEEYVAELKQQLLDLEERDRKLEEEHKAERQAREAAEARARQADTRAAAAEGRAAQETQTAARSADNSRLDAITASLNSHTGQMASLKSQYQAAYAEGDAAKLADIQADMSLVGARITQLESGKQALEARKQTRDAQPTQQQPSAAEQRESWISQQPTNIRDWLRGPNGDRYFGDAEFRDRVTRAATKAEREAGISVYSDKYVPFVEEELGLRKRPEAETARQQNRSDGRDANDDRSQSRMVAAPAGGSVPNTNRGSSDDQVYLTREEKEQARRDGISEADWAKAKRDLIREGAIGPNARSR